MKANILQFPEERIVADRGSADFLVGYAAGLCDVYRNSGEYAAENTLRESGISLSEFTDAGVEDYDLETLQDIFKIIGGQS